MRPLIPRLASWERRAEGASLPPVMPLLQPADHSSVRTLDAPPIVRELRELLVEGLPQMLPVGRPGLQHDLRAAERAGRPAGCFLQRGESRIAEVEPAVTC